METGTRLEPAAAHVHIWVSQGTRPVFDAVLLGFEGNTLIAAELEHDVSKELLAADMCLAIAEIPGLHQRHRVKLVALAKMFEMEHDVQVARTKDASALRARASSDGSDEPSLPSDDDESNF